MGETTSKKPSAAEQIAKLKADFQTGWNKEKGNLSSIDSDAWHREKSMAAVKSAPWFKKSNNIGPKLDKLEAACDKLDQQINAKNFHAVVGCIVDLKKALTDFKKNRQGGTDQQTAAINKTVDIYLKIIVDAGVWLAKQEKAIAIFDAADLKSMISGTKAG